MHFLTKEFLAAPDSGLPSALLALSLLFFFLVLVLAAPDSGLPSALMALQAESAKAGAAAKRLITIVTVRRFIGLLPGSKILSLSDPFILTTAGTIEFRYCHGSSGRSHGFVHDQTGRLGTAVLCLLLDHLLDLLRHLLLLGGTHRLEVILVVVMLVFFCF